MDKTTSPLRDRAIRLAYAVNRIEGVPVTENARRLSAQWARGEITGETMKSTLLTKHRQIANESSNE